MSPTTTEPRVKESDDDLARVAGAFERAAAALLGGDAPAATFEPPRNSDFGDFACTLAFALAKRARRAPQQLAVELIERAFAAEPSLGELVIEATPLGGFINLRFSAAYWRRVVARVLRERDDYGRGAERGEHLSLEFGSANPTGPLVVVQGRTLSLGDSLAKTLRFAGYRVTTEWIVNDAGSQIDTLGRSVHARYRQMIEPAYPFPEDGYPGDYVLPLAERIRARDGARWDNAPESEWLHGFAREARDVLVAGQVATCARFGVAFDRWQSERELHEQGAVAAGIAALRERGLIEDREGAVFMRATDFGDDKDRVVVRGDGRPTYYGADIAYHHDKLTRVDRAILILGPDHHGYISRLEALADAFGRPGAIQVQLAQQMTLVREGEIVGLSKRAGNLLTLDEILDEVGVDAARFFFVLPNADSPMTFDLSLAKEQSSENPVFYVQYGHARIGSIERRAGAELVARAAAGAGLERLGEPAELALMRRLAEFPSVVQSVATGLAPNRMARYAQSVAADFHQFYMACKVLGDDEELSVARLGLARAAKLVLASSLTLLGVSAPESMEREPA